MKGVFRLRHTDKLLHRGPCGISRCKPFSTLCQYLPDIDLPCAGTILDVLLITTAEVLLYGVVAGVGQHLKKEIEPGPRFNRRFIKMDALPYFIPVLIGQDIIVII